MWCVTVGEKEPLEAFMDGGGISACAHGLLKRLNESFDETIGRRMVGSAANVLDTIVSKEVGEVLTGELQTAV